MTLCTNRCSQEQIGTVLRACGAKVKERAPGQWNFTLPHGKGLSTRASVRDGWLLVDAPLPIRKSQAMVRCNERLWDLLRGNARLCGGAKYALRAGRLRLRAEVPLDEDVDAHRRLRQACEGLEAGLAALRKERDPDQALLDAAPAHDEGAACDLRQLCDGAGWPSEERKSGRLAVGLEVPDRFCQASLQALAGGGVRVAAELTAWSSEERNDTCRRAVAVFLLSASALVRMARPTAEVGDGGERTLLEVAVADAPRPAELARALSALSVGCRVCGREVKALEDEKIAARYLKLQGILL